MTSDLTNTVDDHSRTIIHIDLDCFYAQVEMIKVPSLYSKPLGIQQKNIIVTSNYVARKMGVKKCMMLRDAVEVCPNLVIVKGEDLYEYRKTSHEVTAYLQQYSHLVERLGLDENYVDITNLVDERIKADYESVKLEGHIFGEASETCHCGCEHRLKLGSMIAQEIREGIKEKLKLTSCAGIAHNKLLAKLVGSQNKPNQQTTIFPNSALELMLSLGSVTKIPGIGSATAEILERLNVSSVEDLQNCSLEPLISALNLEKAQRVKDLSYGSDFSLVKVSGRPQSIGLEDSCRLQNIQTEIKQKFHELLTRLMILVREDGRIPTTIKVTVRKFDSNNKISHRETRQCNINSNLFNSEKSTNSVCLNEQSENKLLSVIMHLFNKLVDTTNSYHITLLGLSFTKFQERCSGKNSIASYFVKNVAVQSITSLENTTSTEKLVQNLPCASNSDVNCDGLETEVEPSPKRSRIIGTLIERHRYSSDSESPSKLRVADLHLNSRDGDQPDFGQSANTSGNCSKSMDTNQNICCPPNANESVFRELPVDVQRELWDEWKHSRSRDDSVSKPVKKSKTNTLLNYFIKN